MDILFKRALFALVFCSMSLMFGCDLFDDDDDSSDESDTTVSGSVIQGPVAGSVVYADLNSNQRLDAGESWAITDSDGEFTLVIPAGYGSYELVSSGGIDTISGELAVPMRSPQTSGRITPVTTIVASLAANERETFIEKIETATGGNYDDDPSETNANSSLVTLTKSIEQTVRAVDQLGISDTDDKFTITTSIADALADDDDSIFTSSGITASTLGTVMASNTVDAIEDLLEEKEEAGEVLPIDLGDGTAGADALEDLLELVVADVADAIGDGDTVSEADIFDDIDTIDDILNDDANSDLNDTINTTISTVSMELGELYILDSEDTPTEVNLDDPSTITASAVAGVRVVIEASNTFSETKSYTDISIVLSVQDRNSDRMVQFTLSGVDASITSGDEPVVTLTLDSGTTLATVARDTDGDEITTEDISGPYAVLDTSTSNTLEVTVSDLEELLADGVSDEFDSIVKAGTFDVSISATGAPLISSAISITIQ